METAGHLKERFNDTVVLDKQREKMVNMIMHPCREIITDEMKKDEAFRTLFQEVHFSGSYFDKLAVGDQYDFDLNLIFNIPNKAFEIIDMPGAKDFFKFKVVHGWKDDPKVKLVVEDGQDHISAVKMHGILQTALDRALTRLQNKITLEGGEEVSVSRSEGMAVTVCLKPVNGGNYSIDLDLVAVLRFPTSKLPSTLRQHLARIQNRFGTSVEECLGAAVPLKQEERLQVDFPQVARDMMDNKPALKMAIRLLKAERNDIGGPFDKVKSFMMKMVALHCVMDNPGLEFWEEKYLVARYRELRNRLQQSLETDMLTDIFFPNLNLMERIKVPQVKSDVSKYLHNSN